MRILYSALLIAALMSGLSAGCKGRKAAVRHELKRAWLQYAILANAQRTLGIDCNFQVNEKVVKIKLELNKVEFQIRGLELEKDWLLAMVRTLKLPATHARFTKRRQQLEQRMAAHRSRLKPLRRDLVLAKGSLSKCKKLLLEGDHHFSAVQKRTEQVR